MGKNGKSVSVRVRQVGVSRRYGKKTSTLRHIFSEFGLIRLRVFVECAWLQHLSEQTAIAEISPFGPSAIRTLEKLKQNFTIADAQKVSLHLLSHTLSGMDVTGQRIRKCDQS